jgi:hypothetical protein
MAISWCVAQVWYMLAKDEGHGFQRKGNRDAYTSTEVAFFQRVFATKSA